MKPRPAITIERALGLTGSERTVCDPRGRCCTAERTAAEAGELAFRGPGCIVIHHGRDATREALDAFKAWARRRRAELLAIDDDRARIPGYLPDAWLLDIPPERLADAK